ncbi:MAG: hypothetical protein FLDDKLPJ_01827 [Phycisphaerae bacterium]|nr:hypothetical protein [Phycisphaerae bacterium]
MNTRPTPRQRFRHAASPVLACAFLALAGCRSAPGDRRDFRVAEPWELKGPFRIFASDNESRAEPGQSSDATTSRDVQSEEAQTAPASATDPGVPAEARPPSLDALTERPGLFSHGVHADEDFWYLDVGFRLGQVRLEETSKKLDLRLDPLLALDAVGLFDEPYTPRNRKTDWGMTTQYLGIGRRETDWLTWNFYLGYGFGGDVNHDRVALINIDVDFQYNFIFTGLTTDLYPWGKPKHANYPNWRQRFQASRPFLLSGVEIGYVRARGRGYVGLAPLVKIYKDTQSIEDWLFSYLIGLGWELPIDDRCSFAASIHYTFHFYRPEEYNGYNITTAFRYRF